MGLLDNFLRAQCDIADPCGRIENRFGDESSQYDFIVIGGGSAGSVVASRLSENPNWKVLLLEAGWDEPPGSQVPSMVINYHDSEIDWKYLTEPESKACLGYPQRRCKWIRGKVLGGCSVLNGMMYLRGNPRDYDSWGVAGWSYPEVLPYFMKSEDNQELGRVEARYHGSGGPLTVGRFPHRPPLADDILKAGAELGFPPSEDLNGELITGFSIAQATVRNGARLSSAKAFLRPARNRANLDISLNSTATKIIIDKNTKKVLGVEYLVNGQKKRAAVSKEIIVSAGAVNSPQILLLSGIGPADDLKKVGVPVVHDLPGVGKNLHNHVAFFVEFILKNSTDAFDLDWTSAVEYMTNRKGPMSSTGMSQVTGKLNSKFADPSGTDPDLQFFFAGHLANCARTGTVNDPVDPDKRTERRIMISPVVLHPKSRGVLKLKSSNPTDPPLIYANYLADPADVSTLVEGTKIAVKLGNTKILKEKYGFQLDTTPVPACKNQKFGTDKYWECAVRQFTGPENHQAGSCRMGRSTDPNAVVDPELKVRGIQGLRVADASILPRVVSGNTNAPAIMVGEKVSDLIKIAWQNDLSNRLGDLYPDSATSASQANPTSTSYVRPAYFGKTTTAWQSISKPQVGGYTINSGGYTNLNKNWNNYHSNIPGSWSHSQGNRPSYSVDRYDNGAYIPHHNPYSTAQVQSTVSWWTQPSGHYLRGTTKGIY